MVIQQSSHNKRTFIIIGCVFLLLLAGGGAAYYWYAKKNMPVNSYADCVAAGNPIMDSYPTQCSAHGKTYTDPSATVTIEGTAVCLPHKDEANPHTLECAIGLKTSDGTLYGVSGDKDNVLSTLTESDKKVKITGTLEQSTNDLYKIKQIIAVKNIETL